MPAVVLFDGICNFCDWSVDFVIDRDPAGYFRFAALQSNAARPLLARCGLPAEHLGNIVLFEDGVCYGRSTAALRIVRRLSAPWPLLYALIIVPRPLRDALYDWFGRNRYRWFGKRDVCRAPSPETRERFLEEEEPAV
jgi:predicted DCC family thiol-disulfide oxidoreductase YuxK